MASGHWNDDALVRHAYGIGPQDGHPDQCPECAARWRILSARRQRVLKAPPISEELLVEQRRAIRERLEDPARRGRWLPIASGALAAAALLIVAVLVQHRPGPALAPLVSDSQLYAESYSIAMSGEPEALEVMHALFEEEVQ